MDTVNKIVLPNVQFQIAQDYSNSIIENQKFLYNQFKNCNFTNTIFQNCQISFCYFGNIFASGLQFVNCTLTGSDFFETDKYLIVLDSCDLTATNFKDLPLNLKLKNCFYFKTTKKLENEKVFI
jgi:uncharacterized protein YjbI with pentapeptide repeats